MRDISGTITSGGVAQTLFDNQSIPFKGYCLQNRTSVSLYVNENGTAAASGSSIIINPGELYESPPNCPPFTMPLSIFGSTTSSSFHGRVW